MDILSEIRIKYVEITKNSLNFLKSLIIYIFFWTWIYELVMKAFEIMIDFERKEYFDCNVTEFHETLIQSSLKTKKTFLSPDCRLFDLLCIYFSFFFRSLFLTNLTLIFVFQSDFFPNRCCTAFTIEVQLLFID
jgi:hypothetical protein